MEKQGKQIIKQHKVSIRPIASLLIGLTFFSVILLVTMFSGGKKPAGKVILDNAQKGNQASESSSSGAYDSEMLAVVKEIEGIGKQITLFDTDSQETVTLTYTGGSNIIDKYGQIISISQIPVGVMVDVGYQKDTGKLMKMQISTKAWEYIGVHNQTINLTDRVMKLATTRYKYTDNVIILDEGTLIPISNLSEQDELTIRGYEENIWSIIVTKGHGTLKLEDYEAFLGANITVGYEATQQITEDMAITVGEGNFNLTVENGEFSAVKNIMIHRNQETIVSLGDLGPKAEKMGRITFEISPFGADLMIDGVLSPYANPIELTYGEHEIEVSLGGYTTYSGILNVAEAGRIMRIDLPETASGGEVNVISEENTGTDGSVGTDTGSSTTDTGNTDTGNSETDTVNTDTGATDMGTTDAGSGEAVIDKDHLIYVQNPAGASVYVNGEFKGISPVSFAKVIGNQIFTFIKDGYETTSSTINVLDDGKDTYISMTISELSQIE